MDKRGQDMHSADGLKSAAQVTQPTGQRGRSSRARGNKKIWWIGGAIVVVVALLVGGSLYTFSSQIDSNKYQAVFLSNGQVYFGKLHNYYTNRPYLSDVYYIQAPSGTNADANANADTSNQQLVKLGSEVHGPENEMILNKSSILFVENLTDDGKVVKLIQEDKKDK